MISKRKLTKWRKEALVEVESFKKIPKPDTITSYRVEIFYEILLLTQELLDQHLLKEINKDANL